MTTIRAGGRVLDRTERHLSVFYNHICAGDIWVYVCAAAFIYLLMNITPFGLVLREDAYNFAIKGMEIANGDLSLDRPQAIGWPLLLGLVYSVMSVDDIFEAMYIARWTSIVCMALCVVALGKACREIWPGTRYKALTIAIVLAFGSAPLIFSAARSAMSEALFLLSVLGVVYFTARATARDKPDLRYLAVAAALTAVSYYVRPNGLFIFAALLITLVLHSWGSRKSLTLSLSVSILAFVLIVLPYLYARHAAFGSPFDYGPNSKYFVDHYEQ
ncbi:glycosyltransferase family 39 protein, partial [Gammaproteobacteria bacterium]|nr:glycosyltransferase family 39 protein [Gammaproteobacteria bacterium]